MSLEISQKTATHKRRHTATPRRDEIKNSLTGSVPSSKKKKKEKKKEFPNRHIVINTFHSGWGFGSVVERLPSNRKAMGSVPQLRKKEKKKKKKNSILSILWREKS